MSQDAPRLIVPDPGLAVLIGASGTGKSSLARRLFSETEHVSSDRCRALIADTENDQTATRAAFELFHLIVRSRLEHGRLTVADATNVEVRSRAALIAAARAAGRGVVAIVLHRPLAECLANNRARPDRRVPDAVVSAQHAELYRNWHNLRMREDFDGVHELETAREIETVRLIRRSAR